MKIFRIGFLGMRTANHQQMAGFLRDVLGLPSAFEKPDWAGFHLPTGKNDFVEVFGPSMQDTNFFPDTAGDSPMVAFIVDDVVSARAEIEAAGIELLSEVIWVGDNFGWFFFRAPDGNVYCLQQVPE